MSQTNRERNFKRNPRGGYNKNRRFNDRNEGLCFICGQPGHISRDCTGGGSTKHQDIEENQLKTLSDNFSSSELSYDGSDKIVFIPQGDDLKGLWKSMIKRELVNQHKMRHFITSCLAASDKKVGHEVEQLVSELGRAEGLKRIREIVMFPMSVDAGLASATASFQRVILPFMALLTRSGITECNIEKYVHPIFYTVYTNLKPFMLEGVIPMLETLVQRNDISDRRTNKSLLLDDDSSAFIPTSMGQFFLIIVRLCNEFMKRIKEASINDTMSKIVDRIEQAKRLWKNSLDQTTENVYSEPLVSDIDRQKYFFMILDKEINNMNKMLNNGQRSLSPQETRPNSSTKSDSSITYYRKLAKKVALMHDYDPPGELSKHGPRHDNDFSEIAKISIIPTKNEVLCKRDPFLPTTNMDDSLHYLPKGSQRLLDTQFRLLREDLMCPIRLGIVNFIEFLKSSENNAKIKKLRERGGRHKYDNAMDGTNGKWNLRNPPMRRYSENKQSRVQYWSKSRKLMNGSLVCLLWPSKNDSSDNDPQFSLFFGTVSLRDENLLAQKQHTAMIDISFIDTSIYIIALKEIMKKNSNKQTKGCFMVESTGVYFESYFHILKTLQQTSSSPNLPFEKYLAPQVIENSSFAFVDPPTYARAPGFEFDLSAILEDKTKQLSLNVVDTSSHKTVIQNLKELSRLDESQAQSLVYSLCREIALIEGPPGTGKTFVGVELMRVLLANRKTTNIGPILTICFTNHALDQFLENLLKVGIQNIVRLGSRSKSDIIRGFNLEEICRNRARSKHQGWLLAQGYKELEEIQKEAERLQSNLTNGVLDWSDVTLYLKVEYPDHFKSFQNPDIPDFLFEGTVEEDDDDGEWKQAKRKRKKKRSIFRQWVDGNDLHLAQIYEQNWLLSWTRPTSNRSLEELKLDSKVWQMSSGERATLFSFWKEEIQSESFDELDKIQESFGAKTKEVEEIYNEGRRQILRDCDVIGMTTNGAAKFQNLIRSIGPRIIICEEAGEVLEAHILSALTPATQQLILIAPPSLLYILFNILFERLVNGDQTMRLEKSQLHTQRRMRKEVSDLIRLTLYNKLVDDEKTVSYPDVRGAQRNVYFMDHRHPEDSGENDFVLNSHSNTFEVEMVVELVKYFVRNGYNKPSQIAVLTPYLGQLIKIRDALQKSFVVVIDERDDQMITNMEEGMDVENENTDGGSTTFTTASEKKLSQQVILRTVDNFQGEEADIVIVSLVRNCQNMERGNIGFLKSRNRSNVLLSRAKHGMYLLGNAELMEKHSDFWKRVLLILHERGQIGPGFPILCAQHPDYKNSIYEAMQFSEISPDGGCFEPCQQQLKCGHTCPYKCHSDDPQHVGVFCRKDCMRLHSDCQHPCLNKMCGEDCGKCLFPVENIELPCGHEYIDAKCDDKKNKDRLRCHEEVRRKLPKCEHEHLMECFESVDDFDCTEKCKKNLPCGHSCMSRCFECQKFSKRANPDDHLDSDGRTVRSHHGRCTQKCGRTLFCGINISASKDVMKVNRANLVEITVMFLACIRNVNKSVLNLAPLLNFIACEWQCEHEGACNLPCGVPCIRLPCDLRCEKLLKCGHQCFGLCGEICPPPKYCVDCTTDVNVKNQVVDLIMQETFAEVDWTLERMVVLHCGHVYTAESLDNWMDMKEYYEMDNDSNWIQVKSITSHLGESKKCPQCRAPIKNVYRYGRATKKHVLDVQNKKFLIKCDIQLKEQTKKTTTATAQLENMRKRLLEEIKLPPKMQKNKEMNIMERESKFKAIPEVIPTEQYTSIEKYYHIPTTHAEKWEKHILVLLAIYRNLMRLMLATKSPPYKLAYEAAVSRLYESKTKINMDDLVSNFESLNISNYDSPAHQRDKFQETLAEVGIIAPKLDVRMFLDAFFCIVNIQKAIFHEVSKIIPELPRETNIEINSTTQRVSYNKNWINFGGHVIETVRKHLDSIITIAKENQYRRHLVLASLELAEFEVKAERFKLKYPPTGTLNPIIQESVKNKCAGIEKICIQICDEVLPKMNVEHFEKECKSRVDKILLEVVDLHAAAMRDRPLTYEEKLNIHKAMSTEFQGSGHWYECPNGHAYTIGDCGNANQSRRCPDCGEAIGGEGILAARNRRNMEFEHMHS
ncbi:6058_t:CDS:10 [Dentiscutata erythropus]|uniref:6058_t:CDS:1 n=1 Tax=Dentiscutata erythropus TaxID=1348616 RepID=A0A9N9AZN1_9GLOM|nr:6058_t:CDS:10 [Dentiscutata erythropus]